jgi:hypothetical protein
MLAVIMVSVITLSAIMLSVIMLSVNMLSVIMLNVAASRQGYPVYLVSSSTSPSSNFIPFSSIQALIT